jgi:hypothetical protein
MLVITDTYCHVCGVGKWIKSIQFLPGKGIQVDQKYPYRNVWSFFFKKQYDIAVLKYTAQNSYLLIR